MAGTMDILVREMTNLVKIDFLPPFTGALGLGPSNTPGCLLLTTLGTTVLNTSSQNGK